MTISMVLVGKQLVCRLIHIFRVWVKIRVYREMGFKSSDRVQIK